MNHLRMLALLSTTASIVSCGGGAGEMVRPKDYKGTDALGASAPTCNGAPKYARPLTVDLDRETRGDLELALRDKGVAVVAYDCVSLRVLADCSAPNGSYAYAGMTRKEETVQMKGLDELKINLPMGAAKLSSDVQAGRVIDLGLVSVGRHSTTLAKLKRSDLVGTGCEGATHFVQRASVGAFSLATGSVGKVSAVADLFSKGGSASSSSERKVASTDGSLEACRRSTSDAAKPPEECGTPLRADLLPVLDDAAAAAPAPKAQPASLKKAGTFEGEQDPCPSGYRLSEGRCTQSKAAAYLCNPRDEAECKTQCEAGSAASCTSYGLILLETSWDDGHEKANARARPVLKRACDTGDMRGCAGYARATFPPVDVVEGKGYEVPRAQMALAQEMVALDRKTCEAGVGMGCHDLATWLSVYEDAPFHSPKESPKLFERACKLATPFSCVAAASAFIKDDVAKGVALYTRGCDAGDGFVCNQLAYRYIKGVDQVPIDVPRGVRIARGACESSIDDCAFAAELMQYANKDADAVPLATRGCDEEDTRTGLDATEKGRAQYYRAEACKVLGDAYAKGKGTATDPGKAKRYYKKACGLGEARACSSAKQ